VETGFPKSMPSGVTRGIMLKQKARAGCHRTITHPALVAGFNQFERIG
jgi:hypothetical protein